MTSTKKTPEQEALREFDREILRSDFVSLFWSAIDTRKQRGKFTMQQLADALGRDKSVVSKWFSGGPCNWEIDTIADIADALDLEIELRARDRTSGEIHTPSGLETRTSISRKPEFRTFAQRGGTPIRTRTFSASASA